jgi:hypothetical protein
MQKSREDADHAVKPALLPAFISSPLTSELHNTQAPKALSRVKAKLVLRRLPLALKRILQCNFQRSE